MSLFLIDEGEYSSDESIFSHRPQRSPGKSNLPGDRLTRSNQEDTKTRPKIIETPEPAENHQDYLTAHETDDDYTISIEEVTDSEEDSDYTEILESDIIPYQPEPPELPPAPPWSRALLREVRGSLLQQKDNHVIFIYQNGNPYDTGAKTYHEAKLLPKYERLTFERARVCTVKGNTLIALPIKYNHRTLIEAQNLKNCLHSLVDVITEIELPSISLSKTERFDDLPWSYIINQFKKYLQEIPIHITICLNSLQTPEIENVNL